MICDNFDSKSLPTISIEGISSEQTNSLKVCLLSNINGLEVEILNYGGIIHALRVPDKHGHIDDIVLGLNSYSNYLEENYKNENPYFGATLGRCTNIIKNGNFTIDGIKYSVSKNNDNHCLHGGVIGFDSVFWNSEILIKESQSVLKLSYLSENGEQGFPGNLQVNITYQLTNDNELIINYKAVTDKKTVVNLSNHSYFNLKGRETILDHELYINADAFTENDCELVPTGKIIKVDNTPLDFRIPKAIGQDIDSDYNQLIFGNGYDQNFCLNKKLRNEIELAASLSESSSGRKIEVFTTTPGIQLYTGNNLNKNLIGKGNKPYYYQAGVCLETQAYPDSPNNPNFPSIILNPKEEYQQTTIMKFSTIK